MKDKADKKAYDIQYAKDNVVRKFIPFNKQVPDDARMLDHLKKKSNVTKYIKGRIQDDMDKTGE